MITTKKNDCTFIIRSEYETKNESSKKIAVLSDIHFDSIYCDRKLLKKHLSHFLANDIYFIVSGDCLDLMQGAMDKRGTKSELKAQYKDDAYVNKIIDDFAQFMEPYKENILMFLRGNHDISYTQKNGVDVIKMIADKLGKETGSYQNWIKIIFTGNGTHTKTFNLFHSHSSGSIGKRSKGSLAIDILAGIYPDADIYLTEHSHQPYIIPVEVEKFDRCSRITRETKFFVCNATYKSETDTTERNGWWFQRNNHPRPIGCAIIEFKYDREKDLTINPRFRNYDVH